MLDDVYLGEVRLFGGGFAPEGWALCNGQELPIAANQALFNLIGTTYGGDGLQTFALPDLQGRVPMHFGNGAILGINGGAEEVRLVVQNLPSHTHAVTGSDQGGSESPSNNTWGKATGNVYAPPGTSPIPMNPGGLSTTGGSQPHDNMSPFVAVSYMIALEGMYPSPND